MDFYENFVRMSNSTGKSPSKVAQEIGISKSIISRWKNGGGATDATVQRVADYFGVTTDQLLGKEDIKKPADQKADGLRGTGYDLLTEENRAVIDALIEKLYKSQFGE